MQCIGQQGRGDNNGSFGIFDPPNSVRAECLGTGHYLSPGEGRGAGLRFLGLNKVKFSRFPL